MSELELKIEILESETVKTDNGQTVSFNIESPTDWRMSCEGLMMQVHTLPRPINFQTDEDLVTIEADQMRAKVDFMPYGIAVKTPENASFMMAKFVDAITAMLAVQKTLGDKVLPSAFLLNTTQPEMANFLRRFGFKYVKKGVTEPNPKEEVLVIAKTDEVLEKFERFKIDNKVVLEKLKKRAERQGLPKIGEIKKHED